MNALKVNRKCDTNLHALVYCTEIVIRNQWYGFFLSVNTSYTGNRKIQHHFYRDQKTDNNSSIERRKEETLVVACFTPHRMHAVDRCGLLLQMSHVAWSVCLCMSDTLMNCTKTAASIEMPFGEGNPTHKDQMNHVLDGVKIGWIHLPLWGVRKLRCGLFQITLDSCFSWHSFWPVYKYLALIGLYIYTS